MQTYQTVYEAGSGEIVEKKSRFIAHVFPVHTEEEVLRQIEQMKKKYWDARHNCYAYILGDDGGITRCSDDGEPSGTAGRPILDVLTGQGLTDVLVVVTRYFGGTLLGTGGLIRAYSAAAQEGLKHSRVITKRLGKRLTIRTDYNGIGKLQYVVMNLGLPVEDTEYGEDVRIKVFVAAEDYERVEKEITEASNGQAGLTFDQTELFFSQSGDEVLVFEEERLSLNI